MNLWNKLKAFLEQRVGTIVHSKLQNKAWEGENSAGAVPTLRPLYSIFYERLYMPWPLAYGAAMGVGWALGCINQKTDSLLPMLLLQGVLCGCIATGISWSFLKHKGNLWGPWNAVREALKGSIIVTLFMLPVLRLLNLPSLEGQMPALLWNACFLFLIGALFFLFSLFLVGPATNRVTPPLRALPVLYWGPYVLIMGLKVKARIVENRAGSVVQWFGRRGALSSLGGVVITDPKATTGPALHRVMESNYTRNLPILAVRGSAAKAATAVQGHTHRQGALWRWVYYFRPYFLTPESLFSHGFSEEVGKSNVQNPAIAQSLHAESKEVTLSGKESDVYKQVSNSASPDVHERLQPQLLASNELGLGTLMSWVHLGPECSWIQSLKYSWSQPHEPFPFVEHKPWPSQPDKRACYAVLRELFPWAPCVLVATWPKGVHLTEGLRMWQALAEALELVHKRGIRIFLIPLITPDDSENALLGSYGLLSLRYGRAIPGMSSPLWVHPLWETGWPDACWQRLQKGHTMLDISHTDINALAPSYLTAEDAWRGLMCIEHAVISLLHNHGGLILQGPLQKTYQELALWMGRLAGHEATNIVLQARKSSGMHGDMKRLWPRAANSTLVSAPQWLDGWERLAPASWQALEEAMRYEEDAVKGLLWAWKRAIEEQDDE